MMTLGQLNDTGNEGVLRGSVDVCTPLQNRCQGEEAAGRDLTGICVNSRQEVVSRVMNACSDVRETLGVRGPEDDDVVEVLRCLEVADLGS
jgi:hypothetical protein